MDASQIGKRAWSHAGVLQDAGLSCFEYVEQPTLLLFLKMADQLTEPPWGREPIVPSGLDWKALPHRDGASLEDRYRASLEKPGCGTRDARRHLPGRSLRDPRPGARQADHRQKANVIFFDKKEARAEPWTDRLWVYDLRTNTHFTLKQKPIRRLDFDEFVECYKPGRIHAREATRTEENPDGRWRACDYEDLLKRDKLSLDLFWLKDDSLTDTDSLPPPGVIAAEIANDLEAALAQFTKIAERLGS